MGLGVGAYGDGCPYFQSVLLHFLLDVLEVIQVETLELGLEERGTTCWGRAGERDTWRGSIGKVS